MDFSETDLMELKLRADMAGSFTKDEIYSLCNGYAPVAAVQERASNEARLRAEQCLRDERSLHNDKNDMIKRLESRIALLTNQLQKLLGEGQHDVRATG